MTPEKKPSAKALLHPFLRAGLLQQERGNLVVYNVLVWSTLVILLLMAVFADHNQRVYPVEGATSTREMAPFYRLTTDDRQVPAAPRPSEGKP